MSFVLIPTHIFSHIQPRGASEILFTVVLAVNFQVEINGIIMAMNLQSTCYVGFLLLMSTTCFFSMYMIHYVFLYRNYLLAFEYFFHKFLSHAMFCVLMHDYQLGGFLMIFECILRNSDWF